MYDVGVIDADRIMSIEDAICKEHGFDGVRILGWQEMQDTLTLCGMLMAIAPGVSAVYMAVCDSRGDFENTMVFGLLTIILMLMGQRNG